MVRSVVVADSPHSIKTKTAIAEETIELVGLNKQNHANWTDPALPQAALERWSQRQAAFTLAEESLADLALADNQPHRRSIARTAVQNGFVCTNGGSLYVETHYNEAGDTLTNKMLRVSGDSMVSLLSGKLVENVGSSGLNFSRATTNGFAVTNFTGNFFMGLQNDIIDWFDISGTTTGNMWISGSATFTNTFNHWPITNTTADTPVQTMNWNYDSNTNTSVGYTRYDDIGVASAAFTRQMLAQTRAEYSDTAPMQRRTNQTDILLEGVDLERGKPNVGVSP